MPTSRLNAERPPPEAVLEQFRRYRLTKDRQLRNELVEQHVGLVERHVRQLAGRGLPAEDVRQVALLAVLHAVERFDPDMGVMFTTFASRTIDGELKHFLRDRTWAVRPPRRQQEIFLVVRKAQDELAQRLGRSPTVTELAAEIDETEERVLEALEAGAARQAGSLDTPTSTGGYNEGFAPSTTAELDFSRVEIRLLVEQLLGGLDERDRTVIGLRFFDDLGQPEIAERLGLSQSYVSRLIRRILSSLREQLEPNLVDAEEPL